MFSVEEVINLFYSTLCHFRKEIKGEKNAVSSGILANWERWKLCIVLKGTVGGLVKHVSVCRSTVFNCCVPRSPYEAIKQTISEDARAVIRLTIRFSAISSAGHIEVPAAINDLALGNKKRQSY